MQTPTSSSATTKPRSEPDWAGGLRRRCKCCWLPGASWTLLISFFVEGCAAAAARAGGGIAGPDNQACTSAMLCSSLASVFKVSCVKKACLGIHCHPSTGLPRSSVKHTHESGRRPVVLKGAHGFFRCFFLSGPRSPSSASPTPSSPYRSSNAAVSAWPSRFTISVKYACVALCTVACVVAGQRARGDRRTPHRMRQRMAWSIHSSIHVFINSFIHSFIRE